MHLKLELGGSEPARGEPVTRGWKSVLLTLFAVAVLVCVTFMIVGGVRGSPAMVENAGAALFGICVFAIPPWLGHVLGEHSARQSRMERRLDEVYESLSEQVADVAGAVESLEEQVRGGSPVRSLPVQKRENSER